MVLDPTTIVSSLLGSLIGLAGAIAVAFLYIRNHNKSENQRRLHERIQETYFEQGILPTQAAVSEYGTSTVYAFLDLRKWVGRSFAPGPHGFKKDKELLPSKVSEIAKRSTIEDLIQRDYKLVTKWLPSLLRFGTPLYASIKKTLHLYSQLLSDALTPGYFEREVEDAKSNHDELMRSLLAMTNMIQAIEVYLETRLENIKNYFWQNEFENYAEFQKIFQQPRYKNLLSDVKQYLKLMTKWLEALPSPLAEDRVKTSKALSKWLVENTPSDPFEK